MEPLTTSFLTVQARKLLFSIDKKTNISTWSGGGKLKRLKGESFFLLLKETNTLTWLGMSPLGIPPNGPQKVNF